ncbi:MAG: hypothetical protein WAU86_01640, partial [Oricola sp.]
DPGFSDRLGREGLAILNGDTPPRSEKRGWLWTPWMEVETGDDLLRSANGAIAGNPESRARMFVSGADGFTQYHCSDALKALDWEGAVVRFNYPRDWSVEMCGDSCLSEIIFPVSRKAVAATYD